MARSKTPALVAIIVTLLVGSAAYALRIKQSQPGDVHVRFETLPLQFAGYTGREEWFDSATYTVLGADTSTLRVYFDADGNRTWLFVAYFGEQNYGQQIHSPQQCLPGGGWRINTIDYVPVEVPGFGPLMVTRMLTEAGEQREMMYYFFVTQTGFVENEFDLKLHLAKAALSFKARDAAFVRISTPILAGDASGADRKLQSFIAVSVPALLKGLPFQ
jgi:EpsI family protein